MLCSSVALRKREGVRLTSIDTLCAVFGKLCQGQVERESSGSLFYRSLEALKMLEEISEEEASQPAKSLKQEDLLQV